MRIHASRSWRVCMLGLLLALAGCSHAPPQEPDLVFGKRGLRKGDFIRPRAITIGITPAGEEELYIVDFEGRIQALDGDGQPKREWRSPTIENGRPAGLHFSHRTGN